MTKPTGGKRGFASMTPERRREVAAKGGANVPREKRTFAKDIDLARKAGRIGGQRGTGAGKSRP